MSVPSIPRVFLTALMLSTVLVPASLAARLAQIYPELTARKASLGRTMILVDVIVVDDIGGKIEKVKLGESWRYARLAADSLHASLRGHGIPVDSTLVATIGLSLDLLSRYQSDSLPALAEGDTSRVIRAPFYVDSLLAPSDRLQTWRSLMASGYRYARKKGKPAGYLSEGVTLGGGLGCETIGMLQVLSWGIPTTKKVLQHMFSPVVQSSSTFAQFVLVDAKTGEVLWKDVTVFSKTPDEQLMARLVRDVTEDLP